jgi:thymidylate synthase
MYVITAASVDELVLAGIAHVLKTGEPIGARAGAAIQSYNVAYTLTDSKNRVFHLRHPGSERYLCRELLAFFRGSLRVADGLLQASSRWARFSDPNGLICSNYGHYVFYERVGGKTQYEWVLAVLSKNVLSRRAVISINQAYHKNIASNDFPCAISLQFYIRQDALCCCVFSRSEDLYSGLPYDIAFFSFLTELIAVDLTARLGRSVAVGSTTVVCAFTQIYQTNRPHLEKLLQLAPDKDVSAIRMPAISEASTVIRDIYNDSSDSAVVRWIRRYAELE